jgi:DNA-binding helix-hairpin-helix protein with protein kinase domain
MTFYGSHNKQYTTTREIGRGGEGIVYEVQDASDKVLKYYTEPLTPQRVQKLHKMVLMRTPVIDAYAAWPQLLVRDAAGNVCGFIMQKLTGFMPLHMIFSPLDRKRMFPDKGYNFLVHVARNLAVAFHKLHEAGLVVGDVNEGNILINAQGMVTFIDCDSFQVQGDDGYFYCEVGVPRYTPPELLEMHTFDNVVRTTNTDVFSMAVLIFQLLFLGRHPFAGRNKTAADIDEETAIKMREFAYSLTNKKKKLSPPPDSFSISNLSRHLIDNFHQAFEQDQRPASADWIKALDEFLPQIVTCTTSSIHSYPGSMQECPWCAFRREKGIMYFLDDTYLKASAQVYDIDKFVNGFKVEKLELKDWTGSYVDESVVPTAVLHIWQQRKMLSLSVRTAIIISSVLISTVAAHAIAWLLGGALLLVLWHKFGPLGKLARDERRRLQDNYAYLSKQVANLINTYNNSPDKQLYVIAVNKLMEHVERFKQLPKEEERLKLEMEEQLYNENLQDYLYQFNINDHIIASIGQTRKTILFNSGMRTAADISSIHLHRMQGIGPKSIQILLDWQRQIASGFVYIPDDDAIAAGVRQVTHKMEKMKRDLESTIKQEYHSLNYLMQNVTNRNMVLDRQIKDAVTRSTQARRDMVDFKKFSRFI